MTTEPLREVRDHFSDVIDRVERHHERVTVTRNGRPVAVLISPADLAELEETLDILSDPDALADIREADAAYAKARSSAARPLSETFGDDPGDDYELVLTPPAIRALQSTLPEAVAAAVIEFMTRPLVANPRRVGKMLRRELQGIWSARRGTYRVLYRINDYTGEVIVLRIDHRRDVYH